MNLFIGSSLFLKSVDFIQTEHHYGKTGKKLRSQGLSRKEIPHHVIYEPKKKLH